MALNSVCYGLRQTFVSLLRNLWLALASSAMIAISLIILGAFLLVAVNAGQFMRVIESTVEINVFLKEDADVRGIQQRLHGLGGVEQVTFVPKEQGLAEFQRSMGDRADLLSGFEGENNPLPDSFRVRAESADLVPAVAHQISFYAGVDKVRYGEEYVEKLVKITRWVNVICLGAIAVLTVAAVFLIVITIRLSVVARQDEISIMKYLGASNWFVRGPFVLEGMLVGFTGALLAVAALGVGYYYLVAALWQMTMLFFVQPVTDTAVLTPIMGGLLALGLLMGGVGSLISVRKYLRV